MNAVTVQGFGPVSTKFAGAKVDNDLASGIQAGFGLIGYRGKVWSVKYRGDETKLMRPDGDGPLNSIEIVILKASKHISKIYYEQGYVEGSTAAPDCFSTNGVTPEATSTKKQSNACATCPKNAWGSRTTPSGKAGKACQDSKRLAVVPSTNLENEAFGGPMLLRVPPASLQDLASYGNKMQGVGYPYFAIVTRVSFDPQEAFPKFHFNAVRPLTDAEADTVLQLQARPEVERILAEGSEIIVAEDAKPSLLASVFEQPPQAAPQTAPQATPAPTAPTPTPKVEAKPAPAAENSSYEDDLDAKLAELLK